MNKKGIAPLLMILLIGSIIIISYNYGYLSTGSLTGSGSYIERPVFKYVKCESLSGLKYSEPLQISEQGQWLNKPSVTDKYTVELTFPRDNIIGRRLEYYVCNSRSLTASNCRLPDSRSFNKGGIKQTVTNTGTFVIDNIRPNEYVWVQYQKPYFLTWKGGSGATYKIGFIPYGLREYDVLSGSPNPLNPNDCEVPAESDSWRDRLLSTDVDKANEKIDKNVNERVLQPNEVRWYVSGYLTSAAPSFMLTYKGKEAWCRSTGTSAEIYQINSVTLGSGTYKIASPDWSDNLGSETCCPKSTRGDEVCGDNFQWKKINNAECGAFKSCGYPNFVPYSEKQLIKYSCVQGKCQSQIKEVECANDFDCKDSNQLCDLNSYTCVEANVNLKGQKLETIPDNQADCDKKGGKWITQQSKKNSGILCFDSLGLGLCKKEIITQEFCDTSKPNYLLWIALFIVGIIAFIFFIPIFMPLINSLRYAFKSIPVIGKLVP